MSRRARAERRGRVAELLAALWLTGKGYRILAHRARTPYGEADLAAYKNGALIVVEVKARRTEAQGMDAVGAWQRDRIARAALHLAGRFRLEGVSVRLDLMIMRPWRLPIHIRNAWPEDRVG